MSDNEIGVTVKGNIDDIMDELNSLVNRLGEITDKVVSLVVDTDASSLVEVEEASKSATNELESVSQSADDASNNLEKIPDEPLNEVESSAESATNGINALAGAASALGGILVFEQLLEGAGNYEDAMDRMGVATGVGADNAATAWNSTITSITESTGRGAGLVREYITQMGLRGVTSADVLESSFEGIAGAAYITGQSVETVSSAFERVVMTGTLGKRQLTALGLSTDDLGMSLDDFNNKLSTMDATQRTAFLGMIINQKYATEGNKAYMVSWQHVTDVLGRAYDYLMRIVGGLILPVVIPAIDMLSSTLNTVANYISGLDPVSKGLLGTVVLLGGGFIVLTSVLVTLAGLYNALQIAQGLATIRTVAHTIATDAQILSQNALILATSLYNSSIWTSVAALAKDVIVKGAAIALTVAQTVATGAATAAQWLLNAAMSANPIGLVVIAIAALVGGLYLLYQNNEQVRASVNGLWEQLEGFGSYIQSGFIDALMRPVVAIQELINQIKNFGSGIYDAGRNWIGDLTRGIEDSLPDLNGALEQIANYFPRSPAKTGPLSEVTPEKMKEYGASLTQGMADGLNDSNAIQNMDTGLGTFWKGVWSAISSPQEVINATQKYTDSANAATDAANNAAKAIDNAANMTVEDAQKAGISLSDWATSYQEFGGTARLTYDSLANRGVQASQIQQQAIEALKQKAIDTYSSIKQAASDAYSTVTSLLSAYGITIPGAKVSSSTVSANTTDAILKLTKQRNELSKTWSQQGMSVLEYTTQYQLLTDQINNLRQYGYSAGQSWGSGLASGISSSQQNINNAISNASKGLIAHSPPKEGPLSKIDQYGFSIGQTFTEYLSRGLSSVSDVLGMGSMSLSTPLPSSTVLSSTGGVGGVNVYFGDIKVPEGSDPVVVGRGLATGINEGLATKLGRQASNKGINVINDRR
jgi:hypothetical protein